MGARKDFAEMTGPELVEAYNKISGKDPIKKFKDRATALKRLAEAETAKATKTAAPANTKAKVTTTPKNGVVQTGILGEFKFRPNSPREKLLLALKESMGKQVPVEQLASKVFGNKSTDSVAKVFSTWSGIPWRIDMFKLPYEATKTKTDLGLHKK